MTRADARPLRADAARNRARVLEVAYETFAAEGLAVPIDEIARRAGVGPGTVYRHFPTKEALFQAIVDDRMRSIVAAAETLLADEPGAALFEFLREMVAEGAADQGLVDALAGVRRRPRRRPHPAPKPRSSRCSTTCWRPRQHAGTVRADVGPAEVKALLMVCKSTQDHGDGIADRVVAVIVDGLRAPAETDLALALVEC